MGQAKSRGNRDERMAQAQAEAQRLTQAQRPPQLVCNHCQAALPEVQAMDVRSLPGIQVAFGAHCGACEEDTWAVKGEAAAVRAFYDALEKAAGARVKLGTAAAATPGAGSEPPSLQ